MLNPEDLKKKTFTKGFRGYEVEEVDKFLAKLIKEYEYLYLDNLEQKETIERVSSKLEYYQQMEATMQSTLAVAQETADEVKNASEKKAALLEKETAVKCEQQLREAKAAAQKLHDDTMAHAEDLYNQTKNKTDNMLQAAMAECNKLREEAKAYADKLRSSAEVDAEKLRVTTEDVCKKRANSAASEANKLLEDARSEAGRMMLDAPHWVLPRHTLCEAYYKSYSLRWDQPPIPHDLPLAEQGISPIIHQHHEIGRASCRERV